MGRQGIREAGKQDRHVHLLLMSFPRVSKDDGCLSEGNHKSLSFPEVWSLAREKDKPFGNVQREKEQNGHLKSSWVSRSLLNDVG